MKMYHTDRIRQPNWQMDTMETLDVNLQLFAEGGAGSAAGAAGGSEAGDAAASPDGREDQNGRNWSDASSDGEPTRDEW